MTPAAAPPALDIRDLVVAIDGVAVVDGVSLLIPRAGILAIVGESGCGKSLTALSVLRLLPEAARIAGGSIGIAGRDVARLSDREVARLRGDAAAVIFQEPVASLNPLMRVGEQVAEALRLHRGLGARDAAAAAVEAMGRVGIADAGRRARQYPFELSGGMCQRVMIAAALVCRPALLIADEPTTALDVTVQAQILDLIRSLRDEVGTAVAIITHDMGVVAEVADAVAVMYGGRVVERAPVDALFADPRHPYTRLLLATVPTLDGPRKARLRVIDGTVPGARAWPEGCRFRNRCPLADDACTRTPPLAADAAGHAVACWHADRARELA